MNILRSSMNDLNRLVREALERRGEVHQGCFVQNAAAAELGGYGADAVEAIESEVLASMPDEPADGSLPRDLDSVMVTYTKLVRQLQLEHRCAAFLRRLSPRFRTSGLRGIHIIWGNTHPRQGPLPEPLHGYVQELSETGTEPEQRVARMVLRDCK